MDMSIYDGDFTQHDLFGLLRGAPGGRALPTATGAITCTRLLQGAAGPRSNAMARSTYASWPHGAARPGATKRIRSRAPLFTGTARASAMSPIDPHAAAAADRSSSASSSVMRRSTLLPSPCAHLRSRRRVRAQCNNHIIGRSSDGALYRHCPFSPQHQEARNETQTEVSHNCVVE
jgi:hypothetical protein